MVPVAHLLVLSFFTSALACCSLTMAALTWGGLMWTLSFPPTRRRTVAANFVWVFKTWGGCFSMMNVLEGGGTKTRSTFSFLKPSDPNAFVSQRVTVRDEGIKRGVSHLVTRAEMTSVMSALSFLSSSSIGPGRGSCWVRCSQRRICCLFCQIRSASFSHLHDRESAFRSERQVEGSVERANSPHTRTAGYPAPPHVDLHSQPAAASSSTE